MFTLLRESTTETLGIEIQGKLTQTDYQQLMPTLEQHIEQSGQINLVIQFKDFEGIEPAAIWEDLKFDLKHYKDFNRIAMVGSKEWMKWMTKLSDLFFAHADVKYFEPAQQQAAWRWARAEESLPQTA